jgi:hypothetical protein
VGVQDTGVPVDQVIGVQGGAGDMSDGGLVRMGFADHRVGRAL